MTTEPARARRQTHIGTISYYNYHDDTEQEQDSQTGRKQLWGIFNLGKL